MALLPPSPTARILAVLGPTNTGKTHLAVERMLGHRTGVIGLPLRLLAREIYDRVVAARGRTRVALVTGEEKIVPSHPAYFVCTVESMPLERDFDFLAVDEIQLAADAERGHVFTDRLLRARGTSETMFLGADTVRRLVRRLVPEAEHIGRPRFSTLSYGGARKLSRLPRRSAVVTFSANDVYALAELVRRQRGGTAVVLGALSPRTRNAQVAMFQAGEVDYMVATDAIGMGLNMDLDHVALASLHKFDGRRRRALTAAEIGQIAGRAGRHMSDGAFGVTAEVEGLDEEVVERVENHRFQALDALYWRNPDLRTDSIAALLKSLETPPATPGLIRVRDAVDHLTLRALGDQQDIARSTTDRASVRLLWEVCQIPDFRKIMADAHARLLGQIYRYLRSDSGVLPTDWVARLVDRLDRTEGDIDTLSSRIAHIRTWTYISHRPGWIADERHWQERARAIEDRLSDALHARLTQRFVDRRTSALVRGLREKDSLLAFVEDDGAVIVEGELLGHLDGFLFVPDATTSHREARALKTAAHSALRGEIGARIKRLAKAPDGSVTLRQDGCLWWEGAAVARLKPGNDVLRPRVEPIGDDLLGSARAKRVRVCLEGWLERRLERVLKPLLDLRDAPLEGTARGIAFQLTEALGVLPRRQVAEQLRGLGPAERRRLTRLGVRIGMVHVFLPELMRRDCAALKARLWSVHAGLPEAPALPRGPVCAVAPGVPEGAYAAAGLSVFAGCAVRVDAIEQLAAAARRLAAGGPFQATRNLLTIVGGDREALIAVLAGLGYPTDGEGETMVFAAAPREPRKGKRRKAAGRPRRKPRIDPDSPFALLGKLKVTAR